jgi:hypothetical protein
MRLLAFPPALLALAMTPLAAIAQDAPLPDTRGVDADILCFTVVAAASDDAKQDAEGKAVFDSAAAFYAGRVDAHFHDAAAIKAAVQKELVAFKDDASTDSFEQPCLKRYIDALRRIHTGASGVTGGVTDKAK